MNDFLRLCSSTGFCPERQASQGVHRIEETCNGRHVPLIVWPAGHSFSSMCPILCRLFVAIMLTTPLFTIRLLSSASTRQRCRSCCSSCHHVTTSRPPTRSESITGTGRLLSVHTAVAAPGYCRQRTRRRASRAAPKGAAISGTAAWVRPGSQTGSDEGVNGVLGRGWTAHTSTYEAPAAWRLVLIDRDDPGCTHSCLPAL